MSEPADGAIAPDFTLPTDNEGEFSLAAMKGNALVLFFYPRDDTAGCTSEALGFTAVKPDFDKLGVAIAGMSPDPVKKHAKFRQKHGLGITLISDEARQALEAYGVWKEKSMYGKKYMGVERSTFLIGRDGRIARVWRKVSVPGHVEEVLDAARKLA